VDKKSDGRFKKVVKFLKRWNYEIKQQVEDSEFTSYKSFHIEEIIKQYYIQNPTMEVCDALLKFYEE
jgi:hypothetical protein